VAGGDAVGHIKFKVPSSKFTVESPFLTLNFEL
jgi:hypothetical protein